MLTEKVKEIKGAEEKADKIIEESKKKSAEIMASLNERIEKLREDKENKIREEIKQYRTASDKETEGRMNALKEKYSQKISAIKKESEGKIADAVESGWEELKDLFPMQGPPGFSPPPLLYKGHRRPS